MSLEIILGLIGIAISVFGIFLFLYSRAVLGFIAVLLGAILILMFLPLWAIISTILFWTIIIVAVCATIYALYKIFWT